jgi:hypothetical protein
MKSISLYDLALIPELSQYPVTALLHPDMDKIVNPYLYEMGFRVDSGLQYMVSYHRRLTKEACSGFVIVGEIRGDVEFLNSVWCTAEDRIIQAGSIDQSLAKELSVLMGCKMSDDTLYSFDQEEAKELWQEQEEIDRIESELEALEIILKNVRGDQKKRDGSFKKPRDYHEEEPPQKVRKPKANRSTLKHRKID